MRQSTFTFGVLLFAFIVYITMRGQLPQYMALFTPKPKQSSSGSSGGGGLFGNLLGDAGKALGNALPHLFGGSSAASSGNTFSDVASTLVST